MSARCPPVVREISVGGHLVDRYVQVRTTLVPGSLSRFTDIWRTYGGHFADTWRTLVSLLDLTQKLLFPFTFCSIYRDFVPTHAHPDGSVYQRGSFLWHIGRRVIESAQAGRIHPTSGRGCQGGCLKMSKFEFIVSLFFGGQTFSVDNIFARHQLKISAVFFPLIFCQLGYLTFQFNKFHQSSFSFVLQMSWHFYIILFFLLTLI